MAHLGASAQTRSRSGELSGIGRVGWTIEEFRASCSKLAGSKETSHIEQRKCHSCPLLHCAESVEGCDTPSQSPRQSVMFFRIARRSERIYQHLSWSSNASDSSRF